MFSSKVGLTKGSEYPAHPDIPTIGFISCGVFTFVLTAGYHDDDGDGGDEDDDEEEEEHHDDDGDATIIIISHCPLQPSMGWLVQEQRFHQVSPAFLHEVFVKPTKSQLIIA